MEPKLEKYSGRVPVLNDPFETGILPENCFFLAVVSVLCERTLMVLYASPNVWIFTLLESKGTYFMISAGFRVIVLS